MARVRMVTRTVVSNTYNVMCVDTSTAQIEYNSFVLTGEEIKPEKALPQLKRLYETDTLKLVSIDSTYTKEELFGMPEIEFLKYATRLDPETRKKSNRKN